MSDNEVNILKKTFGKKNEQWEQAFKEYNDDPGNLVKLSMRCASCWYKVIKYHLNKISN